MENANISEIIRFCKADGRELVFGDITKSSGNGNNLVFRTYTLYFDVTNQDRAVLRLTVPTTSKGNLKKSDCSISWEISHYNEFDHKRGAYNGKYDYRFGDIRAPMECKIAYDTIRDLVAKELPGRDKKYSSAICEWLIK